jgi:hypothetical protein
MSKIKRRAFGLGFVNRPRPVTALRLAWACLLAAALAFDVRGDTQETPSKSPHMTQSGAGRQRAAANPNEPVRTTTPSEAEIAALRAEANGQLQAISPSVPSAGASAPSAVSTPRAGTATPVTANANPTTESAGDKQIRELLQERLRLLDEYDKASAAFKKANNPDPTPEKQADEAKSDLARRQALLTQAATNPEVLLPQAFRASATGAKPSVNAEMKGAIETATGEVKESKAKLETLRTEVMNWEGQQNARRAERDRLFQAVVAMKAPGPDRAESPAGAATASATSQRLAHERQVNAGWKARVVAMRLQALEAQIALEAKLAGVRELSVQVGLAQVQVAEKTLELMQSRYSAAAEQEERILKAKAAAEENTARRSDDPLERFRARRQADLLDLEAKVIKHEEALATSPPPSLVEQTSLADRAVRDFAGVKELLDDGRVSRLDAIRLNNDFRRIGPERDRLLRNEMAPAEVWLQYYEDALTGVEIELLQDSVHDRYELELLKDRLPPGRLAEAEGLLADIEGSHRALLIRQRKVLEQLTDRTAQTLEQIARRLAILDEEYSFIRTHIFWVRDREPIGPGTITQGARECQHIVKALLRLAQESARPSNWGRPSAEFVTASLAVLGLPIGLVRLRRMLRARIVCELPADGSKAT